MTVVLRSLALLAVCLLDDTTPQGVERPATAKAVLDDLEQALALRKAGDATESESLLIARAAVALLGCAHAHGACGRPEFAGAGKARETGHGGVVALRITVSSPCASLPKQLPAGARAGRRSGQLPVGPRTSTGPFFARAAGAARAAARTDSIKGPRARRSDLQLQGPRLQARMAQRRVVGRRDARARRVPLTAFACRWTLAWDDSNRHLS